MNRERYSPKKKNKEIQKEAHKDGYQHSSTDGCGTPNSVAVQSPKHGADPK